jgi:hypothetical protein
LGKFAKNHQEKEKNKGNMKQSKQSTLDNLSFQFNIQKPTISVKPEKAIVINRIVDSLRESDLEMNIEFALLPSKAFFSKINLDVYFENQLLKSTTLGIPQSPLLNDNFDFPLLFDMRGISAGTYLIRVEMYEPWSSDVKLNFTVKEIVVNYVPQTRESKLVKIPTVKSIAGSDLTIISSSAKEIYRELQQDLQKETLSKRDEW